ncbi:hypothetical protein E2C01_056384 [Portunus trituberculatus]|uniref:C3H1-type domain-containing protein n=1 Tax=Portunus trituberculatus TaxID=210409 RepID=A0A5B7GQH2_PORTR|nr:hypothetical protein [Portunus trituberculatus]
MALNTYDTLLPAARSNFTPAAHRFLPCTAGEAVADSNCDSVIPSENVCHPESACGEEHQCEGGYTHNFARLLQLSSVIEEEAEETDEMKQTEESHKTSLDSQGSSCPDLTQSNRECNSTEPKEQTEVESNASTSRDVFGSCNAPEDIPLTLLVSQTQNSSNSTQLDRGAARAQEVLQQSKQTDNKKLPKKSVCRYYRQGNCTYGKMDIGYPIDHPRACLKLTKFGMDKEKGCRQGRHCKDYHPQKCNNSLYKGECLRENCQYMHVKGTVRQPKYIPNPF